MTPWPLEAGFSIFILQGREVRGPEELGNLPKVTQLENDQAGICPKFAQLQSPLFAPHPAIPPLCALHGAGYMQVLRQVLQTGTGSSGLWCTTPGHLLEPKQWY